MSSRIDFDRIMQDIHDLILELDGLLPDIPVETDLRTGIINTLYSLRTLEMELLKEKSRQEGEEEEIESIAWICLDCTHIFPWIFRKWEKPRPERCPNLWKHKVRCV